MALHVHAMSSITNLNQNLRALCAEGRLKDAINIVITTNNTPVQASTYIHLLQSCIDKKALSEGKKISSHINDSGHAFATHPLIQTKLINMFDKCGSVMDARHVFDNMCEPDVFSWNVIIAAYRNHGCPQQAFKLFHQMQRTAVQPDHFTLSTVLPVCANTSSLKYGLQIHGKVIRCGFQSEVIVMNTLIDMYSKYGRIHNARQLFDKMQNADVVSWNAMIAGYVKQGELDEAFMLFSEMPQPNVVSWTSIIAGYAQNGFVEKALDIFKQMQLAGVKPTSETFSSIVSACAKIGLVEQGMGIHQRVTESGMPFNIVVANALIDMYTKCGSVRKARQLFDEMFHRNVISWTTMIAGYTQNGHADKALEMFNGMQVAGVKPNSSTFASILTSCAKMGALEQGMEVHSKVIESGHLWDIVLVTALLDMYTKCGNIEKGHKLFNTMHNPDVVSWNALITGYANIGALDKALKLFNEIPHRNAVSWTAVIAGFAQNGLVENALEYFKQMLLAGIKPSSVTFASILPACAKVGALEQGMETHEKIIERGLLSEVFVANTLIHMYAKCGTIQKAYKLFDKMPQRTIISWNAMIAGYAMHGYSNDALKLFALMKHSGTNPNHEINHIHKHRKSMQSWIHCLGR
ncbi:pentatricopeptide repeat-containing protein At2g13600-like isoform X2 [Cryptomeria japonica]|uniref:pentatricopeptide repeat-containing protein At2g13600-like isoform X2 n=1 Tax=Cryptomeria japonica TaxID=3369 RepID=UPI0027D9FC6A|nr:pentatricopeptide repeat-containing protein At2g13600-like isoform X2 [Cryptomeria japonica]